MTSALAAPALLVALKLSLEAVNFSSTTSQSSERSVRPLRKTEVALTPSVRSVSDFMFPGWVRDCKTNRRFGYASS